MKNGRSASWHAGVVPPVSCLLNDLCLQLSVGDGMIRRIATASLFRSMVAATPSCPVLARSGREVHRPERMQGVTTPHLPRDQANHSCSPRGGGTDWRRRSGRRGRSFNSIRRSPSCQPISSKHEPSDLSEAREVSFLSSSSAITISFSGENTTANGTVLRLT